MSDDRAQAFYPYLMQTFVLPEPAGECIEPLLPILPPRGFMLHSWAPTHDGRCSVLWVRYKSDQIDAVSGFPLSVLAGKKAENG